MEEKKLKRKLKPDKSEQMENEVKSGKSSQRREISPDRDRARKRHRVRDDNDERSSRRRYNEAHCDEERSFLCRGNEGRRHEEESMSRRSSNEYHSGGSRGYEREWGGAWRPRGKERAWRDRRDSWDEPSDEGGSQGGRDRHYNRGDYRPNQRTYDRGDERYENKWFDHADRHLDRLDDWRGDRRHGGGRDAGCSRWRDDRIDDDWGPPCDHRGLGDYQGRDTRRRHVPGVSASPDRQAHVMFNHMLSHSDVTDWSIDTLQHAVGNQVHDVRSIAQQFPDLFELSISKGIVDLKCPLAVCTDHWSTNGCISGSNCRSLHVCKFFIMGSCPSSNCKFGHEFYSRHNTPLLVEYRLDRMSVDNMWKLIKKARCFREEGLPPFCTFHNSPKGCKTGKDGAGCPFLHVCERFVKTDTCTFADDKCRYSHDLMKPQTMHILIKYGLDVSGGNQLSVLHKVRQMYYQGYSVSPEADFDSGCRLDVCTDHWSVNGCNAGAGCRKLHVCKFFVMDSCPSTNCKFGHLFQSSHNTPLLVRYGLNRLKSDQLMKLVRDTEAFNQVGLPPICTYHNKPMGCKTGKDGVGCPFMHVCERFVKTDTCKFASGITGICRVMCRNSHDLTKPQTKQILLKYGFKVTLGNQSSVLQQLRQKYNLTSHSNPKGPLFSRQFSEPLVPCQSTSQQGRLGRQQSAVLMDLNSITTKPPPALRTNVASTLSKAPSTSPQQLKSVSGDEICTFHLRGKCRFDAQCQLVHAALPYQWQREDEGTWRSCDQEGNKELEKAFCQPENDGATVAVSGGSGSMKVDFQTMAYSGDGRGDVRRLSTESWGKAFKNRLFITKWQWYFRGEHKQWQEYKDSLEIEEEYLKDGASEYEFQVGQHSYVLYFKGLLCKGTKVRHGAEMFQKNKNFETEREVRRRPRLHGKSDDSKCDGQKGREEDTVSLPDSWLSGAPSAMDYELKLVDVLSITLEYAQVEKRFTETMSDPIKRITRIQNFDLWEEYAGMKRRMLKKKLGSSKIPTKTSMTDLSKELNEKLLFHGTRKKFIEPIYTHRGFDFRNAGSSSGTLYGKGNYFARDASFSVSYTHGCRKMFAVKVLVGDAARGNPSLTKPPPRDASQPYGRLYDCCVNSLVDPRIFVTFEFGQSYPAYLIEY